MISIDIIEMLKTPKIHYANTSVIAITLKFQPAKNTWFTIFERNVRHTKICGDVSSSTHAQVGLVMCTIP